jgi:hypothetical protein
MVYTAQNIAAFHAGKSVTWAQHPPTCPSNGFARIKSIVYRVVSIRGP